MRPHAAGVGPALRREPAPARRILHRQARMLPAPQLLPPPQPPPCACMCAGRTALTSWQPLRHPQPAELLSKPCIYLGVPYPDLSDDERHAHCYPHITGLGGSQPLPGGQLRLGAIWDADLLPATSSSKRRVCSLSGGGSQSLAAYLAVLGWRLAPCYTLEQEPTLRTSQQQPKP